MARITVPGFSGVVRITAPQRLEDHQAQVSIDADFRSGDLRPYYGDKRSTTFGSTYSVTDPASLFLYDQGQLIVADEDLNFARSPVFFSDNQGNDKRVFYADNTSDSTYPRVLDTFPSGGAIPTGAKRLGVPKPAATGEPEYEQQTGTVTEIERFVGLDTKIVVDATSAATLTKGDKILLDVPGIAEGPYTIYAEMDYGAGTKQLTLRNSEPKKTSMVLTVLKDKSDISFVRANGHTFQDGDQVFLYKKAINPSDWYTFSTNKLPSGYSANIYTVFNVTGNSFQLAEPDGSEFATTSSVSDKKEFAVDVFLLATQENELPTTLTTDTTYGMLSVSVPSTGPKFLFQFTVEGAVAHEWANASTADVVRDRSYCATFVNAAGDESEPSVPSKVITVAPGDKVTFTQDDLPLTTWDTTKYPLAEYATPTELRLYRTDELGVFRLVTTGVKNEDNSTRTITWAALNTSGFTFVDTYPDTELGEPLMTTGWSVPVAGLRGLVNCPNGIVAGFRGRTVFGSVPYAPYAWPIANQVATDYDVVGLVPTSAGLVVVTKGMPAILIGDNPANWSMQKLEYPQGCVARRSIVDMGEFAMYASPDGLVAIAGANVEILTKTIMTREQWQEYNPETLIAAQVEGRYIATYQPDSGSRKGFIYDPQTQSFTDLTLSAAAFCNDLLNDVLLMWGADGKIYEWNQDTTTFKPYFWISKWFQLPIPEIMGVAQIFTTMVDVTGRSLTFVLRGYDNNTSVKIYEISTSTSPDAILGNRPFRVPYVAPGRFTAFRVELSGSIPIGTVMVGRVVDELKESP